MLLACLVTRFLPHRAVAAGHWQLRSKVHLRLFGNFARAQTRAAMLFVREFRPIDGEQFSFHLFHLSTEERLQDGGNSACGLWFAVVWFAWFVVGFSLSFSTI